MLCLSFSCLDAAITGDLVRNLPGLTFKPTFKHYSGYLKATGTRKLHYWFTESSGNPSSDPLVLWMNGGPGCSSLDGLLTEHGPFRVQDDGKTINKNPFSWNRVANMLYLEAPAGVGYSYSDDQNYTTTDDQVSLDNYWALKYFLIHYPEFAQNDFFITGESYGGVYVPTLAARIMEDNTFNFKGFAVGNGLTDYTLNGNSLIYFGYYHGLFGSKLWGKLLSSCCAGSPDKNRCNFVENTDPDCRNLINEAMSVIGQLNMYNLYAECYRGPSTNNSRLQSLYDPRISLLSKPNVTLNAQMRKLSVMSKEEVGVVPPCIDATGATNYLNRPAVRKSLHIPPSLPTWAICSGTINYIKQYMTMKDVYKKLISANKYRILVYNGDVDMACNFLGDQWFVDSLGLKVVKPWGAWMYKEKDGSKQVAGFRQIYENNVAFTTIKGAGHMVPTDKPIPALDMFTSFLQYKDF